MLKTGVFGYIMVKGEIEQVLIRKLAADRGPKDSPPLFLNKDSTVQSDARRVDPELINLCRVNPRLEFCARNCDIARDF